MKHKQESAERNPLAEQSPLPDIAYTGQQLLAAKRFTAQQKDILSAVLRADKEYTIEQAEWAIKEFLDGSAD